MMMRAGRSVACLVTATGIWLAGVGLASADPSSSPSTSAIPASSSPTSSPSSPAAPSSPTTPTTSPASDPPGGLTATFNNLCTDFGFDVTNGTAVAHTVHIEVNGTQVGAAVTVAPGATAHVPLAADTEPASQVQLVDETGAVISSLLIRFCTAVENISATIAAGAIYTKTGFISPALVAPDAQHGVVTSIRVSSDVSGGALRYTPNPCFAGTDRFGYSDFILSVQGVITVTVLPGTCRVSVHRSTTDCATKTVKYTATNPYSLPAHLIQSNSAGPGTSKDLVVPAHHTMVISTVTLTGATTHTQVSFKVRDSTHTVLTDQVSFSCAAPAGHSNDANSTLPATGAAPTRLAVLGGASIALGALLMWLVRPRRAATAAKPRPRHTTH